MRVLIWKRNNTAVTQETDAASQQPSTLARANSTSGGQFSELRSRTGSSAPPRIEAAKAQPSRMPPDLAQRLDEATQAAKKDRTFEQFPGDIDAAYNAMFKTALDAKEYSATLSTAKRRLFEDPLTLAELEAEISQIDRARAQILTSLSCVLPKLSPDVQSVKAEALLKEWSWVNLDASAEMLERVASALSEMDPDARDAIFARTMHLVTARVVQHGYAGQCAHALPYLAEAGSRLSSYAARVKAFETICHLTVHLSDQVAPSRLDMREGVMPNTVGSEKLRQETFDKLKLIVKTLSANSPDRKEAERMLNEAKRNRSTSSNRLRNQIEGAARAIRAPLDRKLASRARPATRSRRS